MPPFDIYTLYTAFPRRAQNGCGRQPRPPRMTGFWASISTHETPPACTDIDTVVIPKPLTKIFILPLSISNKRRWQYQYILSPPSFTSSARCLIIIATGNNAQANLPSPNPPYLNVHFYLQRTFTVCITSTLVIRQIHNEDALSMFVVWARCII